MRLVFGVFLLVAMASASIAAQDADTKAARTAVDSWLKLIDTESYAASWDEAASGFKNAIPSETWQMAVRKARAPFGPIKTRTFKSATPAKKLPGAPDGEYVVVPIRCGIRKGHQPRDGDDRPRQRRLVACGRLLREINHEDTKGGEGSYDGSF